MSLTKQIAEMIEASLNDLGYDLVRVKYTPSSNSVLQIMAERRDEAEMTVDDCELISHTVSALMDVADPIKSAYNLEVSSPGLDRPLTRLSDFERFAGEQAKIDLIAPQNGRKRFSGIVRGAAGDKVRLETTEGVVELPFAAINSAKLEITEEMLREVMRQQAQRAKAQDQSNDENEEVS